MNSCARTEIRFRYATPTGRGSRRVVAVAPFFVPLYMMLVLLFTRTVFSHYALGVKIYLVWVVVLFTLVLPALSLVVLRALGRLADYRIDRRRDRYLPLALGALFYLLCALTLVKVPRLSCCARSWWPPPAAKSSACW